GRGGVGGDRVLEGTVQVGQHADEAHARDRQLAHDLEAGGGAQAGTPDRIGAVRGGGGVLRGGGDGSGGGREEGCLAVGQSLLALPRRSVGGAGQRLCTATRSHTKIRVSPGAMTGGAPRSP